MWSVIYSKEPNLQNHPHNFSLKKTIKGFKIYYQCKNALFHNLIIFIYATLTIFQESHIRQKPRVRNKANQLPDL